MSAPTTPPANHAATDPAAAATDRGRLVAAHEDAAEFYRRTLLGPEGEGPRRYLTDRGFEALLDDTPWTVGYAPDGWTRLRHHLTELGYRDETLLAAGLTRPSRRGTPIDSFRDRITFGVRDHHHRLVGFTARCSPDAPAHVPKYLNTPNTVIYDKGHVLFGLGEATAAAAGALVLTEGPLDAIAVNLAYRHQHPHQPSGLALCGTAMTESHRNALATLDPREVILAFDDDTAGARARKHAYQKLRGTTDLTATERIPGSDLAEAHTRKGPQAVSEILASARPAIDVIIDAALASWPNRADNAEAAIACLRSVAQLLRELKPTDVAHQATRLSESIRLPTNVVTRELADAVTRSNPTTHPTASIAR